MQSDFLLLSTALADQTQPIAAGRREKPYPWPGCAAGRYPRPPGTLRAASDAPHRSLGPPWGEGWWLLAKGREAEGSTTEKQREEETRTTKFSRTHRSQQNILLPIL